MFNRIVALSTLILTLWTLECYAQQYQYSRGWTPGKRSSPPISVAKVLAARDISYIAPASDAAYSEVDGGYRTYSPAEIEDIQRAAYIAGLYRDRPYGNERDRYSY